MGPFSSFLVSGFAGFPGQFAVRGGSQIRGYSRAAPLRMGPLSGTAVRTKEPIFKKKKKNALREYLGIKHTVKGEDREVAIPNLVTQPVFKMLQRQHSNDPDAEEALNLAEKDHAESSRRTTAALAKSIRQVRQPNPFADMFGSRSSAPCPKRRRVERMPALQFGSSQASSASTPRKAPGTPDKKQDGIPLKLGF